jgi:HPr kinase/phosphorylase
MDGAAPGHSTGAQTRLATVHASAVLLGARAVLIRGPSGCGKSRLALDLIESGRRGTLLFSRLVADDRVHLDQANGRLLARPAAPLAGLIEVRGIGLLRLSHEPCAAVGWVVDLAAADAGRLPDASRRRTEIYGIELPRLAVAAGVEPLPAVLTFITSSPEGWVG